ncbi:MAG: DNA repair protein RadA [Candidatus Bipolaricaulota bacterium]|nr:DNA repair protein RadA [Candidatus Bipolaricaulota bacterium]MBS3791125.1 DNA repair protein RadA [Candidatus Bipolaricaulota bacterium]
MAYKCKSCGYTSVEWLGRCPKCGDWDSFRQSESEDTSGKDIVDEAPKPLSEISFDSKERLPTGIGEFDRVLGGGLIPGSVTLLGGDPGIGKSTLLLQAATNLAKRGKVLYISGEESSKQLKMRADRLGLSADDLIIYSGQSLENAVSHLNELEPICVIVDSIQSLQSTGNSSSLGSTKQVRELGREFTRLAKKKDIATLLIGHITKSGDFSGPKTIEHLVDSTVYFEGKRDNNVRMMRPEKNRFGSTRLLGLFQMTEKGLQEILNPSQFFAKKNGHSDQKGTTTVCTVEGTRPILVEIQALVTPSNSGGSAQRRTTGLDYNRASLLFAVIQKQLGINLQEFDIYLNVVGGFKVEETAADLGIVSAILSSFQDRKIDSQTVIIGEVGLSGEIRPVKNLKSRVNEAEKLGYRKALIPENHAKSNELETNVDIRPVSVLADAISELELRE